MIEKSWLVVVFSFLLIPNLNAQNSKLKVVNNNGFHTVEVLDKNGHASLKTPKNGLWAITTN